MSSVIASATCAVASDVRKRRATFPPASLPELLRIAVTRSGRVLCSAGNSPKAMPVTSESAAAKPTAGQLSPRPRLSEISAGSIAVMPRSVHVANSRLATPPMNASVTDSVSSCDRSCRREAPSDRRTAISISRLAARAMRMLAMFAQAIRSTSPVIAKSMKSGPPASSPTSLCPRRPSATVTCLAANFGTSESRMLRCSGSSTSLMIGW